MMARLQDRLSQLQSVLNYLNEKGELDKVKEHCFHAGQGDELLHETIVYNFVVSVDLQTVLEQDVELGNTILTSLANSTSLFQEVIFEHCSVNALLPPDITSTQICTTLRVTNFPLSLHSLQIKTFSDLTKFLDYPGFIRLIGITTGLSGPAKYTKSTKYMCTDEECEGHYGNKYIRTHVPGASEAQTIRSDFRCRFCGEILEEVKTARMLSDKVVAEIVPIRLLGQSQRELFAQGRVQAVPVFIRDDLVEKLQLGKTYEVIGTCRSDLQGESIAVTMEANHVSELQKLSFSSINLLPKSLQDAYKGTSNSPWRFPFYLAYRFGEQVLSRGVMLKLKLVLLMSLALDPQKQLLHVVSLGRDVCQTMCLMNFAQKFAKRSFPVSVTTPLCSAVRKESSSRSPYFIQAGSLSLASSGVCLFGDLDSWQKQNKDQLQRVLSSQKMFIEIPGKGHVGLPQQEVLPLRCHVWGCCGPSSCPQKSQKNDLLLPAADTGQLSKPLLDSFGYIAFLDVGDTSFSEETFVESSVHTLVSWSQQAEDNNSDDVIQFHDIEQFLCMARGYEPEMTVEAEMLLHNYYMACRMARSSDHSGSDMPSSALQTLTSLAVGFAKLKLEKIVREEDALMAVYLYEESLTSRFGLSVLNVQPQPHIPESQLPLFLGKEIDLVMHQFQGQLMRFCSQVIESRCVKTEE